ncbi:MAG: hypothetical protein SFY92_10500 [Verrucomicrobiae bacterium]|nr:hypothetical protein [Verrucomicrobiae bacterium]
MPNVPMKNPTCNPQEPIFFYTCVKWNHRKIFAVMYLIVMLFYVATKKNSGIGSVEHGFHVNLGDMMILFPSSFFMAGIVLSNFVLLCLGSEMWRKYKQP